MSNKPSKSAIKILMNPTMSDAILLESEKERADYYKKAYEQEKEKIEILEKQLEDLNKSLNVVHDAYIKTDKKYKKALSKSGEILRSAQD